MTKRLKVLRRSDSDTQEGGMTSGLFIAPKRTLLDHYLTMVRGRGERGGREGGKEGREGREGGRGGEGHLLSFHLASCYL